MYSTGHGVEWKQVCLISDSYGYITYMWYRFNRIRQDCHPEQKILMASGFPELSKF